MIYLSAAQTAYIVIVILSVILVGILIGVLIFKNIYRPKHIRELTYLRLKNLCDANDYLLLNNYKLHLDDNNTGTVDHVVISNKYIILINDFPISGVLSGDFSDDELRLVNHKGTNRVVNPLNYNYNLAKRMAIFNDLGPSLIKGLVVINSDSKVNITSESNQFKIIRLKDLRKTIKQFDKVNVKNLKEDDVVNFINYLDRHNLNK